jgi:ketosteroid isomerase-like protein
MSLVSRDTLRNFSTALAAAMLATAVCLAPSANAQATGKVPSPEQTRADITALLNDFLKPGNNDQAEWHERFWAEDLVYTSSAGIVKTKAEIRQSFKDVAKPTAEKANPNIKPPAASTVFSAEDILVRPYGEMAALTFRLAAKEGDGKVSHYRNSGTFLYRGGKWQVVTWQATKVAAAAP